LIDLHQHLVVALGSVLGFVFGARRVAHRGHQFDDVRDLDGVHAHTQDGERWEVRGSRFRLEEWQFWVFDFGLSYYWPSAFRWYLFQLIATFQKLV